MKDKLSDQQTNAILSALTEAIEKGPWDESNFLKMIGKELREIREKFKDHISAQAPDNLKSDHNIVKKRSLNSGQREIFISLYSLDGLNLQAWERILINLPKQMISRPIYENEEDVQAIIKTKENKNNEAYVAIYVNSNDILSLPPDKTPRDKLGKSLLTLKDKSFHLDNIELFVHKSDQYRFFQGRLVKNRTT